VTDPFADYGKRATSTAPDKLVGVIKTRAAARLRYSEIVAELNACEDADMLGAYLESIRPEVAQYRAEIQHLWDGEDDFPGLANEIQAACERLEYPVPAWAGSN
jgi:hypothetical protein